MVMVETTSKEHFLVIYFVAVAYCKGRKLTMEALCLCLVKNGYFLWISHL